MKDCPSTTPSPDLYSPLTRPVSSDHPVNERHLDNRNHHRHHHLRHLTLHSIDRFHPFRRFPALPKRASLPHPTMTQPPMNREIFDLTILFTSAFIGATIAFLAALVTFTFHHEIRERLVQQGLIVPPHGPRPENPRAPASAGTPTTTTGGRRRPPPRRRTGTTSLGTPKRFVSSTMRTTRTGTYRLGISPPPSLPGETETTTHGEYHPTLDPIVSQPTGRFGIPTPSTSWTGINPVAPEQQPVDVPPTYQRRPPRLGRAPWRELADVLEDRTQSLSPPPIELSVLPSTSNDDPAQTSDTDTLVDRVTIFPYLIFSAYLISSYLGALLISLPKISTYRTTFNSGSPGFTHVYHDPHSDSDS